MERKHFINIGLVTALLAGCSGPVVKNDNPSRTQTSLTETFTPFQPESFVPTVTPIEAITSTVTPEAVPPYKMFGIDFADPGKKVDIKIVLPNGTVFNINSTPEVCESVDTYGSLFSPKNFASCEYQFRNDPEDMAHFVHSGWYHEPNGLGGFNYFRLPAERIREYLEDVPSSHSDYDRLTLAQIKEKMAEFLNAPVKISQGDTTTEGLKVLTISRVPQDKLGPFNPASGLTNEDIWATLAAIDPTFAQFAIDGKAEIVIIFCGWQSPEETPTGATGFYDWSRYAIVLGK